MQSLIKHSAQQIRNLKDQIDQAFREKPHGPEHKRACDDFHSRYDGLAFPGGYEAGLKKIQERDADAIETALCFIEVEPYFFRSQYIRTKLIRLLKQADLAKSQKTRLNNALNRKNTEQTH